MGPRPRGFSSHITAIAWLHLARLLHMAGVRLVPLGAAKLLPNSFCTLEEFHPRFVKRVPLGATYLFLHFGSCKG